MRPMIAVLLFAAAVPLAGQATVRLSAGATASTALIQDAVLGTTLRSAVAPTVAFAVSYPTGKGPYRVLLEGSYARAPINVTDNDFGTHDQLAAVATITTLLLAEGPIHGQIHWQLGGGAIFYRPSMMQGVFQDGGTQRWLIAGGLVFLQPINPKTDFLVTGRIDTQTFTTDVLMARGYGEAQSLQRYALLVGVNRKL